MPAMDLNAYLERIGMTRPATPDLASLHALQRAHLFAIPFENFDVQLGRRIEIDTPSIYRKIIERKRGGWCYEMNGLFGWALGELGYRVTRLAGAVGRERNGDASQANHLALRVDLEEGTCIADVGFGSAPIVPYKVEAGAITAHDFNYELGPADGEWWRLVSHATGSRQSYDFTLHPADENALAAKCDWLQTAPESPFVQNVVAQRFVPEGFNVLLGRVFKIFRGTRSEERLIGDADEFVAVLATDFALDLPEAASLWPKICTRHETLFGASSAS